MAADNEHGRIPASTAKTAVTPLGFWRKGRSRVWLADRGFWLAVVEFQPSGFSKGSYVNCAAHWLWSAMPAVLSLDSLAENRPWGACHDAEKFTSLAEALVKQAAETSGRLNARFNDIGAAAANLVAGEQASIDQGRGGGWAAFNAAVAAGLAGDTRTALNLFRLAEDTLLSQRPDFAQLLVPYAETIGAPDRFRHFIAARMNDQRAGFNLGPIMNIASPP